MTGERSQNAGLEDSHFTTDGPAERSDRSDRTAREGEHGFREALQIETVGVIFFTTDGAITGANDAFLKMSGFSRDDLEAGRLRWDEMTPTEWMPASEQAVAELTATGRTVPYEKEYYRKDGSRWWGLFAAQALSDTENVEYILDITTRKRAEAALRRSEEKYRTLFTSMDQGYCIAEITVDEHNTPVDYRMLEVNPQFETLTGLSRQEVLSGKSIRQVAPNLEEAWYQVYGQVALTGEPVRFEQHSEALGRWFDVYAFRIDEPEQRHVAILFQNITERKRAADALRESEHSLRLATEAGGMYSWEVDLARGTFTWSDNASSLIDFPTPRTLEEAWQVPHPDDRATVQQALEQAIEEHGEFEVEYRIANRPPGDETWVFTTGVTIDGADGTPARVVGITQNITERKRAEADRERARREAEEAVHARDEFLSIAAHELRNPATSIKASAQLLRRSFKQGRLDERRGDKYTSALIESCNRLAVLIDDLLDVSRLQTGQLRVHREPTDLTELVRDTISVQLVSTKGHRLRLEVEDGPTLLLDRERIRQILTNMLDNAVKYSPEGGDVRVRLTYDGERAWLSVQDQGIGLPKEALESVFEPFGRALNAAESNIPGMGLGLYICRRIAEAHGGTLWAESEGEGHGATMCLWLPIRDEDDPAQ